MIKLSDVQVRTQYRIRVRYRLMVLEYASSHGPTAAGRRFGVSARTVRRWRARWRAAGLEGLVPRYPPRRQPRLRAEVIEFIRRGGRARLLPSVASGRSEARGAPWPPKSTDLPTRARCRSSGTSARPWGSPARRPGRAGFADRTLPRCQ
jgi:transposase-like protein